jgi:hypothetical protein
LFSCFALVIGNVGFAPRVHLPRLAPKKQMIPTPGKNSLYIKLFPTPRISVKKKVDSRPEKVYVFPSALRPLFRCRMGDTVIGAGPRIFWQLRKIAGDALAYVHSSDYLTWTKETTKESR